MSWESLKASSFLDRVLFGLAFALGWHLLDWFVHVLQGILASAR